MLRVVCALQGKAAGVCPSHLRQTLAAQDWVWNLLSKEEVSPACQSLGVSIQPHTSAVDGKECALSGTSSSWKSETENPQAQQITAHQICKPALTRHDNTSGTRSYATYASPFAGGHSPGLTSLQPHSSADSSLSCFPSPREVLQDVTVQQESGADINGTLTGLRHHLATSKPAATAAWLLLATTKELTLIATLLSTHTNATSSSGYGVTNTDCAAALPSPLQLESVACAILDRTSRPLHVSPLPAAAASQSPAPVYAGLQDSVPHSSATAGLVSPLPSLRLSGSSSQSGVSAVQGVDAGHEIGSIAHAALQHPSAASARDLATLALALAQGGSSDPGIYLRVGDQLAASRGLTRMGVNQLVNVAAAFAMAGMAHSTLLDAIAEAMLPGSAGERHLASMPQLATLAGAYAQLCYSHRPLLDSIATKFLALNDKWGLEDAEHVASIAAACAQLQLDRPRVYITALTYTTDHAMEMSSAGLLKLLRAAAHVTAPHNQGANTKLSDINTPAPALTVCHPHMLHCKTESGGAFYIVERSGRQAPIVRSPLDGVVSAQSTGASMLDIQLQPAFAANLGRFVTKACQLLKHDLPDLGLDELAVAVDSCASLSQLHPVLDVEVSLTSVFPPSARSSNSRSSSTWDESFGAAMEGEPDYSRECSSDAAEMLQGGGPRSSQGSAAAARIRAAASDPVFLQQVEGSAVALVGSHSTGDGVKLPVVAQMLLGFAKLGHTASVLRDASTRLALQLSTSAPGLSNQPTETVLQLLSGFAWHARSEQHQQQHQLEFPEADVPLQALNSEHREVMQALITTLVPRLESLQPREVLEVLRAAQSQDSAALLSLNLLDAINSHVSAQQEHVPAETGLPVMHLQTTTHPSMLSAAQPQQTSSSSRKEYSAVQLCNLIHELGPMQASRHALASAQQRLSRILQQQQQPMQVRTARQQAQSRQQAAFPADVVLSSHLVCSVVGVSARQQRQEQGDRRSFDSNILDLLSDHITAHIHSYSPAALAQMLRQFSQVPGYRNVGLTDALVVPLTRYEAMEDMSSDTWLSTSLALSSLGHQQERTFEMLAARGVKLIRAHMPPAQLMDAMFAYTSVNVYSKALFNALCRYCLLQLHLLSPPMMLRLFHHLSDSGHKELETVMVLARSVREQLADFTLGQLMEIVAASLRLQVYHGQLYRDIARRYIAEVGLDTYAVSSSSGDSSTDSGQRWAALHNLVVAYGMSHHKDQEIMVQLATHVHAYLQARTQAVQAQKLQQLQLHAPSCAALLHAVPALNRPHCAMAVPLSGSDKVTSSYSTEQTQSDAARVFARELAHVVWVTGSSRCHNTALMQIAATILAPLIADTREQRYAMRIAQAYASVSAWEPLVFSTLRSRVLRIISTPNSAHPLDKAVSQDLKQDTHHTISSHFQAVPPAAADESSSPDHSTPVLDASTSASDMADPGTAEPGSLTVSLIASVGWAHAEAGQMDAELASALAGYCSEQAGGLSMDQLSMMAAALADVSCGFCTTSNPAFSSSRRDAQQAMLAVKEVTRVKSRQVSDATVAQALSTHLCRMASWDEDFGRVGRSLASRAAAAVQARKSFRRMWQYPKYVF